MNPKTNPTEFLNHFASRLTEAESIAGQEAAAIKMEVERNQVTVQNYDQNGVGLMDATRARAALDAFDRTVWSGGYRPSPASANSERGAFLARLGQTQAVTAKGKLVRDNANDLADALASVISGRSRNRQTWREGIVDASLALERRIRLESLGEHDVLVLLDKANKLDAKLAEADTLYQEANRYVAKLRETPDLETFQAAQAYAEQIHY